MSQDDPSKPKKDLTGIMDLPQADPVPQEGASGDSNPFEVNELKPIEQIDDFASLDQIGMMDHPTPPEEAPEEIAAEAPAQTLEELSEPTPETTPESDPFQSFDSIQTPALTPEDPPILEEAPPLPPPTLDFTSDPEPEPEPIRTEPARVEAPTLDQLKTYSESKKETPFEPGLREEFHLLITGEVDPYARDKLLLFLTENSIGITSSELDFQIKSKRVLLPRIGEFSGVKLIQDLRDSGLSFVLKKSDAESELPPADDGRSIAFHYHSKAAPESIEVPILPPGELQSGAYRVLDSIRMVQYLQAEILEIERSELFQELLDRMTEALRARAKIKGANALTHLSHRITPLRLPSQYQIELTASLLKKI